MYVHTAAQLPPLRIVDLHGGSVIPIFVVERDVGKYIILAKPAPHFESSRLTLRVNRRIYQPLLPLWNKNEAPSMECLARTQQVPMAELQRINPGKFVATRPLEPAEFGRGIPYWGLRSYSTGSA